MGIFKGKFLPCERGPQLLLEFDKIRYSGLKWHFLDLNLVEPVKFEIRGQKLTIVGFGFFSHFRPFIWNQVLTLLFIQNFCKDPKV